MDEKVEVIPLKEAHFWAFIIERHNVYVRRHKLQKPKPWTDDAILRHWKFTNVYRELDAGTKYVIEKLVPIAEISPPLFVFNVFAYRKYNLPRTHQLLSTYLNSESLSAGFIDEWDTAVAIRELEKAIKFMAIQSPAFILVSQGRTIPERCKRIEDIWNRRFELTQQLQAAPTLKDAHKVIRTVPGMGAFMAYEIVIDLNYSDKVIRFSENDWVNAGPGCVRGLDLIIDWEKTPRFRGVYAEAIRTLMERQTIGRLEAALTYDKHPEAEMKPFTLRNIEHSLCEFYKYNRILNGGRSKQTYPGE